MRSLCTTILYCICQRTRVSYDRRMLDIMWAFLVIFEVSYHEIDVCPNLNLFHPLLRTIVLLTLESELGSTLVCYRIDRTRSGIVARDLQAKG